MIYIWGVLRKVNLIKNSIFFLACFIFSFSSEVYAALKEKKCSSVFGTILGANSNTVGYSNCNNHYKSDLWNKIKIDNHFIDTGIKWQCVEYARRWLITQKGYTFASIDHAYQIWDLWEATHVRTGAVAIWEKFPNTKTKSKPEKGDLLIYDRAQGEHGHVSVIVVVDKEEVFIAEQNYSNLLWDGKDYARKLHLSKDKEGLYTLQDLGVIGWMRIKMLT